MTVKNAFGKLEVGGFVESNVAIDYWNALPVDLLVQEQKGSCGEAPVTDLEPRSTGSDLLSVDQVLSDKGPNRGLMEGFGPN